MFLILLGHGWNYQYHNIKKQFGLFEIILTWRDKGFLKKEPVK